MASLNGVWPHPGLLQLIVLLQVICLCLTQGPIGEHVVGSPGPAGIPGSDGIDVSVDVFPEGVRQRATLSQVPGCNE
ncbi:hypothetical protein scyTo_0024487 [Scyliorhinus torazame]|uniref:Collagen IV NC1 domain-containing protein n=1 Tax=Scyliorhinus torazame TaxID=75743 RepID=A0A401QE10_SCYTO|nr:hypothetical protein [Scyliorhinus torazame]